jgi:CYTH domain-containing protein
MKYENYQIGLRRVFLLRDLPEPLTRADEHLQLFDNYIKDTRIRLRQVRVPQTKQWMRILEQRFPLDENDLRIWRKSEIHLNDGEYQAFERFEGREIRKNRYFYKAAGRDFEIDVYLGDLWGLTLAKVYFEMLEDLQNFEMPEFTVMDVTNNKFFTGENLIGKKFADVQAEYQESKKRKVKNEK